MKNLFEYLIKELLVKSPRNDSQGELVILGLPPNCINESLTMYIYSGYIQAR